MHISMETGREEAMRKGGGEESRSVRAPCDWARGDRAAVGTYVDAQGSSLREDETHLCLVVYWLIIPTRASQIGPGKLYHYS